MPLQDIFIMINYFYKNWQAKIKHLNYTIILILIGIAGLSCVMLFSAAGGEISAKLSRQVVRICFGFCILIILMSLSVRWLFYNAYYLYFFSLGMLVIVEICGTIGMGGQRWVNLYIANFQPSECMKVCLVLALARYLSGISDAKFETPRFNVLVPLLIMGAPVLLVSRQPDLGTALMLFASGASIIFVAGISITKLVVSGVLGLLSLPFIWTRLHKYQQERVLTFLHPERDRLGSGYHIAQSKIAIGSGGFWGKGLLQGSQSQLNFLPEKQTDFIFSMICEEFGFIGALIVWALYGALIWYGFGVAMRSRDYFCRFAAIGLSTTIFIYLFTNTAMTLGLIPVVGVPLPLLSYGGSAGLTIMIIVGLLMVLDIDGGIKRYT